MASHLPIRSHGTVSNALSMRERQLLQMASRGHTDQSIANHLNISLATVNTYWGRVRIKIGHFSRTELVAKYLKSEADVVVAALREENKSLIGQIESYAMTQNMLQASLDMFRGLLETAPDAIVIVSEGGKIQFANEQAVDMFGYSEEELKSLTVEHLVPERYRQDHVKNRQEYHEHPTKKKMGEHLATLALRKDGTEFPMATALSAVYTPNGLLITCVIRDLNA